MALAVAGCGGGDDGAGSTSTPAAGATKTPASGGGKAAATVAMKNIQFDPKTVTIKVGDTVEWVNEDSVNHDAVAKEGDVPKSELFGKGGTYSVKFDTAGTIEYVCTVHPGMEGTITVE
jgi:plastocyanin